MKIVVIGGTGRIGSKLAAFLRDRGHAVVAASPSTGVDTITGAGLADGVLPDWSGSSARGCSIAPLATSHRPPRLPPTRNGLRRSCVPSKTPGTFSSLDAPPRACCA